MNRERRHRRIRAKISGTAKKPRLSVFRSNKYVYAQIIDDEKGVTLLSISTKKEDGKTEKERVAKAGKKIGEEAVKKGIKKVVFDRGGYLYKGKIKNLAEEARKGGLEF